MRRLWAAGAAIMLCLALGGAPALAQEASTPPSGPSRVNEWPFIRSSCPDAEGDPLLLVALGTSETAGYGISADEAYPSQYADILCEELGRPVELHSYFPGNESAPLAWWDEHVTGDPALRADLAAAGLVVLWPLSAHDVVGPLLFGECQGDWPDPLKACFVAATADIEPQMDTLFTAIGALVPDQAPILAADAYLLPAILDAWGAEPYFSEFRPLWDPHFVVERMAAKHGFTFVQTLAAFDGPSLSERPAQGLFQFDGIHPTAAGALLVAEVFAAADGLGS